MDRARWAGWTLGAAAGIGVVTASIAALRSVLGGAGLGLVWLYLLAVLPLALRWGWRPALGAALLGALVYDLLFVEPTGSLLVEDAGAGAELLLFLAVSAAAAWLAGREQARREAVQRRAEAADLLYAVSQTLSTQPLDPALAAVAGLIRRELALRGCEIVLADGASRLEALPRASSGDPVRQVVEAPAVWVRAPARAGSSGGRGQAGGRRAGDSYQLALRTGPRLVGALRLALPPGGLEPWAIELLGDVAEQLAASIERERLRRAANETELQRRAEQLRANLLEHVSDDLRRPLAAIGRAASQLRQQAAASGGLDPKIVVAIEQEADLLDRRLRNLVDLARLEGGALRLERDWCDLGGLVRRVVGRLGPLLGPRPLRLELAEGLPPIQADRSAIEQALANLLENVAQHTPPETPVEVVFESADGGQRVCVIDHGPGVPFEAARRLFQPHQPGATRVVGPGFGLAVSRGFVEAHGGWLELSPTDGGGTTCCLVLPGEGRPPGPPEGEQPAPVADHLRSAPS